MPFVGEDGGAEEKRRGAGGERRGAVLLRMNLGIDAGGNVAMKLAARAETEDAAELVHTIISNA